MLSSLAVKRTNYSSRKRASFYLALIFPPISVILCLWERERGGKANISLPQGLQADGRDALVTPVTAPDLIFFDFTVVTVSVFTVLPAP